MTVIARLTETSFVCMKQWTNGRQRDLDTVCTALPPPPKPIKFNGFTLHRVPVMGIVNPKSMIKSCRAKGMKPVCEFSCCETRWNL